MILKVIDNIEFFCEKAEPHCGVFASKKWLSIYESKLTLVGIYKDEHQLIGGFYYLNTKKYGVKFAKLPPYTPHCCLFYRTDSTNNSSIHNFTKEIMNDVTSYFSKQKTNLLILAFSSTNIDLQPFIWNNYKVIPNYTYEIDLQKSLEEIKSNFDSKNRNAINKAIKDGVIISANNLNKQELFDYFYKHLQTTKANIYTSELKNIFEVFSDDTNSFSYSATKNDVLIGVVFCIYDSNKCYYLLGAVNKESKIQGVNNLLIQSSIDKAKELDCNIFDFEGSMIPGVEKFFRSFGGNLKPYFTVNKADLILELILKLKKRSIF